MVDFEKAIQFIRSSADPVENARLEFLTAKASVPQGAVAAIFRTQRPDGGWAPFWAKDYSSLDATCFRLAQAEQLGVGREDASVRRALAFLRERQADDGSWQEDAQVAAVAPPWARPGDLAATLYLTANCGSWLALLGDTEGAALRAAALLQNHLSMDGSLPGFLHTQWLAAGLWYKLNMEEPALRAFRSLEARSEELPPSSLSWLLTTLCAAGVSPNHALLQKAATRLAQMQEDDGRWQSEDGPERDVHATLEAVRALWLCGWPKADST